MTDPRDPYKILQVDPEAEDEVIQAAYRRLARKYHPDVAPGTEAEARMAAINAAWGSTRRPASLARRSIASGRRQRAGTPGAATRRPDRRATTAQPPAAAPPRRRGRPRRSRGTGRPGARTPAAATTNRCGRPTGYGAAGVPPGDPAGSVLNFGRYAGWSLGEIARRDLEYIEWLDRTPIGRPYREEVDTILRRTGRRKSVEAEAADRRGLFRRR